MDIYRNIDEAKSSSKGAVEWSGTGIKVLDQKKLRDGLIDQWVYSAVFSQDAALKQFLYKTIRETAEALGAAPSSIQSLYEASAKGVYKNKTVPAMNIRGITYEVARAAFRAALKNKVGAFIFEIAKSEMKYTMQDPSEYAAVILAAAIKEGYKGPVFIQGDHFQFASKKFMEDPKAEEESLKKLIKSALLAGFYNIDIDASTLVKLSHGTLEEQQANNSKMTAELTKFIRENQPKGVTVAIGGEIGEVGKENSRPEELRAFMGGYKNLLPKGMAGIAKVSVQTGTRHGGVVLPDGSIAKVNLDFETLKTLSELARQEFGMGGAVQHGASTLPDDAFRKFPEMGTVEVHLATGFQNLIYEHPKFPKGLLTEIDEYLRKNAADERKPKQTEEQFIYTVRKKGFGPFKKQTWDIPRENLDAIMATMEEKFTFLFKQLNVNDTADLVKKTIK
ncbi:MAG: class II fructose-bisphosphate aldolase [Planctomycetes bacterium]|nr:class II fructose-bisphosphate aldolase [Planctomycetota bacterium]